MAKLGEWIFLEGDLASEIWMVTEGEVEVYIAHCHEGKVKARFFLHTAKKKDIIFTIPHNEELKLLGIVTSSEFEYESIGIGGMLDVYRWEDTYRKIFTAIKNSNPSRVTGQKLDAQDEAYITNLLKRKDKEELLEALKKEQRNFLTNFKASRISIGDEEIAKKRKEIKETTLYNAACDFFGGFFKMAKKVIITEENKQPDVIYALRIIAKYLKINQNSISISEDFKNTTSIDEIVRQIMAASELYGRHIILKDGWVRGDIGPLLVFKGGKPLAAIPVSATEYNLIDPITGETFRIDESLQGEIEKNAYVFYRALPYEINSLWKWFNWGMGLLWQSDYLMLFFTSFLIGVLPTLTPLITESVFEHIIPALDRRAHLTLVQVMLIALSASAFASLVRSVTVMRMKNKLKVLTESALWIKLIKLPANFFRRYRVGDLALRMQSVAKMADTFSSAIAGGIFNVAFSIFNLGIMFYHNSQIALVAVLLWLIFLVITSFFSWKQVKYQREKMEAAGEASATVFQLLAGISKFKLKSAEPLAFSLWAKKFGKEREWNLKLNWQNTFLELVNTSQPLVQCFVIYFVAMLLIDESLQTGTQAMTQAEFLSFNAAMGSFGSAITGFQGSLLGLMELFPTMERLKPILEEEAESSDRKQQAGELAGDISISDLDFRYNKESPYVLKGITLSIKRGTFLAIVGTSGCGKSTLLRLLLGLENPTRGIIQYDQHDFSEIDVSSVRRQMGVVLQQGQLMSGTLFENIVGSLPLSHDDAWDAAEKVGLADDIKAMPMGMNTFISEGATNISGGQKQRILIARAIVNKAKILIFDEATRALDNETQRIVSEAVSHLNATRIVVAHRLSTVKDADKIVVLDKGKIAEMGNYNELMAKDGLFKHLAERQII